MVFFAPIKRHFQSIVPARNRTSCKLNVLSSVTFDVPVRRVYYCVCIVPSGAAARARADAIRECCLYCGRRVKDCTARERKDSAAARKKTNGVKEHDRFDTSYLYIYIRIHTYTYKTMPNSRAVSDFSKTPTSTWPRERRRNGDADEGGGGNNKMLPWKKAYSGTSTRRSVWV